jgi:hypothetical protein
MGGDLSKLFYVTGQEEQQAGHALPQVFTLT